jgi:small subunit ribosomal protein S4e
MHKKRNEMPTSWPLPRKEKRKRFISVPSHSYNKGISLLFILRDILKIARTRKEVRYMTLNGFVKVNNKIRKDEDFPLGVLDVISLEKSSKNYRLEIVNKKFVLKEVSDKEASKKIVKISGKKVLSSKSIQMNLSDGQNILTKEKFSVGDSVVLNTKENKVDKILPLKEGAKIEVVAGKHAGEKGKLLKFIELSRGRDYVIKLEDKEVSLPFKAILVIE